jgi:uncharacterized protein YdhG (YjbR/CyaY superfamily)
MAERKPAQKRAKAKFSAEDRAAIRDHARELRGEVDGEAEVLAKIAEMPDADRVLAERVHAIVTSTVPALEPRTWYGMPAYSKDGTVVVFFQPAAKFKSRYATLGFSARANLDDGAIWPVAFALTKLTRPTEARIRELLRQAVS